MINLLYPLPGSDISNDVADESLVELYLKSNNVFYFNMLHKRYSGKVFGKCISILKSESLAEDATQDVMIKILLNMSKFSGRSKFSTWIYSITYNYCIDFLRRKKKDPCVFVEEIIENNDRVEEVEDAFILETSVQRLKILLDEIPAIDKSVLLMKYQDDMSIKEIGEILEKSDSAIKMQLKRAKEKFRNMYAERFSA